MLLISYCSAAQGDVLENLRQRLLRVNSLEQANQLLSDDEITGNILSIDSNLDSSGFAKYWLETGVGEILISHPHEDTTYLFKLIKLDSIKSFRVQYIFIDGKKLNRKEIDDLRNLIFKRIDHGDEFANLAEEYSMDGNSKKGGDLGWFEEGQMMIEFQNAIEKHRIGEVFKVDIQSNKWYYIVKKSHLPRYKKIASVVVLQIINNH